MALVGSGTRREGIGGLGLTLRGLATKTFVGDVLYQMGQRTKAFAVFFLLGAALLAQPKAWCTPDKGGTASGDDLFLGDVIPELRIELSRTNLEQLRQHPRTYVLGAVREGKTVYTNVCIRLKGGPGSFRPLEDKPALTLNFGREAPGQRFHSLKKLHLNNSVQDPTYLGEEISRELFNAAGVPTPRAGHARVRLNARDLGLFVLIEGIDKHFFKRYFKDPDGNLYDGHSQNDVTGRMEINSGDRPRDTLHLKALANAAQEPDLAVRLTKLGKTLDVDRFLSFLATEVMLAHWDGYAMNRNNFRIFHDRAENRLVYLPQGVDQVFQRPSLPVFPPMSGLVARSVLEVPELRQRYRERMTQLLTNVWRLDLLTNRVSELGARVQASLVEADSRSASGYLSQVAAFNRRVQQRVRSLERTLLKPVRRPAVEANGAVVLSGWQSQTDLGTPILTKEKAGSPGDELHIQSRERSAGSWRTRVLLEPGRYRFEGRIRLQKVVYDSQDAKSGAGLRISGRRFSRPLPGDMPWTIVTFEFDVPPASDEVELVCELRAKQGTASFDLGSLRLLRQN